MRRVGPLLLLAAVAAAALPIRAKPAPAQEDPGSDEPKNGPGIGPPEDPDAPSSDASTPTYLKAIDLQRKGKWKEAQALFQDIQKKWPESAHGPDCEMRGGVNCYMGTTKLHESGPSRRRIDVTVMGDGFQVDEKAQKQQEEWARQCLSVLFSESSFEEYKDYFNYYFVRLISKDDGVDKTETPDEAKAREDRNRRRAKKRPAPKDFNTALDCKAAGPQGQVMADRDLVYAWLRYANQDVPGCGDDALVIAFAKFGQLGMGGGGIANVGRPDKSVTVHEFGHAFVGLLDEYANNPGPPPFAVRAPNATSDQKSIPWQHFLDKKVDGVGVHEGGATFKAGVWRPAPSCAMNAAGATGFCPVCREASVLRIYAYCSPIDTTRPEPDTEMRVKHGDATALTIVPMKPRSHDLKVEWTFERIQDSEPGPAPKDAGATTDGMSDMDGWDGGARARGRQKILYDAPPMGIPAEDESRVEKNKAGRVDKFLFDVGKLPRGRWVVTARVWDPTPWVLKDPLHLLEERASWWVTVTP